MAQWFKDCDVILVPSSIGEAPAGLDGTGDPLFCRSWTLLGLPCVHLPFARGQSGACRSACNWSARMAMTTGCWRLRTTCMKA